MLEEKKYYLMNSLPSASYAQNVYQVLNMLYVVQCTVVQIEIISFRKQLSQSCSIHGPSKMVIYRAIVMTRKLL